MSTALPRILHAVPSLGIGGTEKVMQLFAMHTNTQQYDMAVFSPSDGPRGEMLRQAGITTFVGNNVDTVLARYQPDIVHIHRAGWAEPQRMRAFTVYKRTSSKPVVLLETNVFGRYDPSPAGQQLDATLFVSHFCAKRYGAQHKITTTPPRYHVVYNPVDTDCFAAETPAHKDFSRPVIGRISRPDPGKWSQFALTFLPVLQREIPDFRYRIIGSIPEAETFIREHNLTANVELLDPVTTDEEIAAFFAETSVLAHANDTGESFGLAIAEAMACGVPVVTHPAQGLRDNAQCELVDHGKTGLIAATHEEYANALLWLLRHPEKAKQMGQQGQQKAQQQYRAQVVVKQLQTIYAQLLGNARQGTS